MKRAKTWTSWLSDVFHPEAAKRNEVVELLQHRYMREKQHAMRYSQHAAKMQYPQFKEELLRIAAEEEKHATMVADKLRSLGGEIPPVVPIRISAENSWQYLRTDLAEEQRCAGELELALPHLRGEYDEVLTMFEQIKADAKKHRTSLRDMLVRSDPQSL